MTAAAVTIFERALQWVAAGTTVGLGSGRAAAAFVELLGRRVRDGLQVRGVASSAATAAAAERAGVPLVSLEAAMPIDLTVDGADEVDPQLNLIKGYGRALLREKILAAASKQFVVLVGEEKLVPVLGSRGKLPIEVVPFAVPLCLRRLRTLGCPGVLAADGDGRPLVTDNGNYVVDCAVGRMNDPAVLERSLRTVPGVVETGLFLQQADVVLVGDSSTFVVQRELHRTAGEISAERTE